MEIFIHIGFHKTGTTFLQQKIFPFLENMNYVHNGRLTGLAGPHNKLLISNEALSGIPYQQNEKNYYEQFCFNLSKLKAVFKEFNLIIGFREPSSLVSSLYKQHLHEGGTMAFDNFFGNHSQAIVKEQDLFFSEFYYYLLENFEKERLFCYEHGQLVNEPGKVIDKLLFFLGQEHRQNFNFKTTATLNGSVPDNLERLLMKLNDWDNYLQNRWGISLNNKYLKTFKITPRIFAQSILPKVLGREIKRDLTLIKNKYATDWGIISDAVKIQ